MHAHRKMLWSGVKMKNILFFIFLSGFNTILLAQNPQVLFEESYATTFRCGSRGITETDNNGFLVVGHETPGDGNAFASVLRIDSIGNKIWSNAYGNPWGEDNIIRTTAWDVVRSSNGNYVISGAGAFEGIVVDGYEFPYNNGYIFEIDDDGTLIWEQSYRLDEDSEYRHRCDFHAIDAIPDGGYVVAGYHDIGTSEEDPPRWNGYIVIINESGEKIQEISYESGDEPSLEWFDDVKSTSDGGFIASGFFSDDVTTNYISDGLVVKFDKNGIEDWHYVYNTTKMSRFHGIVETSDDNFIASGSEQISPPESNLLIFKLSADGVLIDSLLLHNYDHNGAFDVVDADDGYLAAGYVFQNEEEPYSSQAYLLKIDSNLAFEWDLLVGGSEWEEAWAVIKNSDGTYSFAGIQYDVQNTYHHYLVKVSTEPGTRVEEVVIPLSTNLYQNYPNPFNPRTIINYELPFTNYVELSIYNTLGQKVKTLVSKYHKAGFYQVQWDASQFSSGIYYYRLEVRDRASQMGEFHDVKKMILLK